MSKIHGIKITKNTSVLGKAVSEGDELFAPKDISEDNAATLLKMGNRAEEIKPAVAVKVVTEADGANIPGADSVTNTAQLLAILDMKVSYMGKAVRERKDEQPVISDDDLIRLLKAEQDSDTRDNVVKVLESEIKARGLK